MKTVIFKGFHGWEATSKTEANANGEIWQISTHKGNKGVKCYAIKGKAGENTFSYDIFGGERLELAFIEGVCNEKKVTECHKQGLLKFAEIKPSDENIYIVGVGQIIFTDWVQSSDDNKRVIYEVLGGGNYKTVSLDGKQLQRDDHIKNYTKKFGIGTYYNEGETLPIEDVNILVEAATIWQEMQEFKQNEAAIKAAEYKNNALLEGSKIIENLPSSAVALIVAELQQDESDHMTDYYESSTTKTVYLAFSSHTKNNFNEMRNAANNFEDTKYLSELNESLENRENYSGGSGYYLGESKYSGWIIRKFEIHNNQAKILENLQIAAFENRYFCNVTPVVEEVENIAPIEVKTGKIQVIEYGAGLAVVGDTKPIKDKLKDLGGRFNFRLSCGAGWVFKKSDLEKLQTALSA